MNWLLWPACTNYIFDVCFPQNGPHLHLLLNDRNYIFSCPVKSQFSYVPPPPPPPQQLPTPEQLAQHPGITHSPYHGFHYPHLLQVYPPSQPAVAQATSSPHINQESSPHQFPQLPVGFSEYAPGWYSPYKPFYYPAATPAPTYAAKESTTTTYVPPANPNYPWYYLHMPDYPAAPLTQEPAPFDHSQQPVRDSFNPPASYSSSHNGHFSSPGLELQPAFSSHPITPPSPFPPTTTRTIVPTQLVSNSYPSGQFPAQTPICFPPYTTLLPANSPPNAPAICSHYPYPYYHPLYPPPYQHLPQDPETRPPITSTTTAPTTSPTASTTAGPTLQIPQLQCQVGRLVVFLPYAHQDTIQVRGQCLCKHKESLCS